MNNPIAKVYWRTIKNDIRAFDDVPPNLKADIRILAEKDVANNVITPEEYEELIGEPYVEV